MATLDRWTPELQLAAQGAPLPLMHLCLNRAARSFLRQTRAWQVWLDPVQVTGQAFREYSFDLPQGAELLRIERATVNGRSMDVANARDLPADPWRHAAQGTAYLVSSDLQSMTVGAVDGGAVQVYVSLVPAVGGAYLPDDVATLYHEAIREGAKAELLNTPGASFFQPDQAAVSLAYFQRAVDEAGTDVWRSNTARVSHGRVRWL